MRIVAFCWIALIAGMDKVGPGGFMHLPDGPTKPVKSSPTHAEMESMIRSTNTLAEYVGAFQELYLAVSRTRNFANVDHLHELEISSWRSTLVSLTNKGVGLVGDSASVSPESVQTVKRFLDMEDTPLILHTEDEAVVQSLASALDQSPELGPAFTRVMSDLIRSDLDTCRELAAEVAKTPRSLVRSWSGDSTNVHDTLLAVLGLIDGRFGWSDFEFPTQVKQILSTVSVNDFVAAFITDHATADEFKLMIGSGRVQRSSMSQLSEFVESAPSPVAFAQLYVELVEAARAWYGSTDHDEDVNK